MWVGLTAGIVRHWQRTSGGAAVQHSSSDRASIASGSREYVRISTHCACCGLLGSDYPPTLCFGVCLQELASLAPLSVVTQASQRQPQHHASKDADGAWSQFALDALNVQDTAANRSARDPFSPTDDRDALAVHFSPSELQSPSQEEAHDGVDGVDGEAVLPASEEATNVGLLSPSRLGTFGHTRQRSWPTNNMAVVHTGGSDSREDSLTNLGASRGPAVPAPTVWGQVQQSAVFQKVQVPCRVCSPRCCHFASVVVFRSPRCTLPHLASCTSLRL